ncbi:DnaJ domain-containing protein [Fimicolochytrium jonesii]|uniref:DnaJ domain-containing protein n=1 Tax=Fimicolochytrium jonesii TaxID=1396493 RepID=UPI0022FEAB7E|nr:DnaJ domain-containing protein [Fimicolochytrium jonesii]XP_052923396.1 DnaJ domain-containing protein [Fimicolochytrium jonesii]KAI8815981.1 DnaJ domain-containing protein [Fimicolochytrium jonesii]KAI8818428.1 DnaJ domain-containing protein [Fimicolochytrium jonesii]
MAATAVSSVGDYYKVLGINRSADDAAVKKAYRVNALKYHPEKNITPEAIKQFLAIGEAYDVLIDSKRRAIYDQYGPNGLRNGVAPRDGFEGFPGGYNYHGNPEETFSKFFGGTNPFSDFFAVHTSAPALNQKAGAPPTFGPKFGGLHGMNRPDGASDGASGNPLNGPTQDPAIEHDLVLTLEELYLGTVKKLKVSRKTLTSDNTTTTPTTKLLTLDVHRGWRAGTRITFPREGDQGPNKIPSDLTFIVKEAPHEFFKREGDDLIYTVHIPLSKALVGLIVEVKTLDGRVLKVPVNETVHPDYVKVISNEGMPISKSPEQRGKLLIKFVITFPTYLSEKQKGLIREALPG